MLLISRCSIARIVVSTSTLSLTLMSNRCGGAIRYSNHSDVCSDSRMRSTWFVTRRSHVEQVQEVSWSLRQ